MTFILSKVRSRIIRIVDWFYFPFVRKFVPLEIFRYAATGGANTVLDILLYFVCYRYVLKMEVLHLGITAISPHIAAFLIVFPVTFTTGFLLAKYITFTASELKGNVQLFRYGLTVAGSVLLNYIFLKLFVEYARFYATFSKILTTFIVVIYSYLLQRYYSFQTGKILVARKISH
jgi:putative flippase GtrA